MSNISNLGNFPHTIGNLDDRPNLTAAELKAKLEKDVMTVWNTLAEAIPLINDILPASRLVDIVNHSSTDSGVPTAKAVYDAITAAFVGDEHEVAEQIITAWLNDHPEATTTVTDGSITNAKLANSFITPGVAGAYSSSATYAVGDYVYYNKTLYRCITAITTAEPWTAAHWTAAVLGNDVGELRSGLSNVLTDVLDVQKFASDSSSYLSTNGYLTTITATDPRSESLLSYRMPLEAGVEYAVVFDECSYAGTKFVVYSPTASAVAFNDYINGRIEIPFTPSVTSGYVLKIIGASYPNTIKNLRIVNYKLWKESNNVCVLPTFNGNYSDDENITHAVYMAYRHGFPVVEIPYKSGGYTVSNPIKLYSNVELKASKNVLLTLANQANCQMVINANMSTSTITDSNITVNGGTWDGNHDNQEKFTLDVYGNRKTVVVGMQFAGVDGLTLKNCRIQNARLYGVLIGNASDVTCDNLDIEVGDVSNPDNGDGLHFLGPIDHVDVVNCKLRSEDNCLAFNCDDADHGEYTTSGDIKNIYVNNLYINNYDGGQGILLLSSTHLIYNAIIENVVGVGGYFLNLSNFGLSANKNGVYLDVHVRNVVFEMYGNWKDAIILAGQFRNATLENLNFQTLNYRGSVTGIDIIYIREFPNAPTYTDIRQLTVKDVYANVAISNKNLYIVDISGGTVAEAKITGVKSHNNTGTLYPVNIQGSASVGTLKIDDFILNNAYYGIVYIRSSSNTIDTMELSNIVLVDRASPYKILNPSNASIARFNCRDALGSGYGVQDVDATVYTFTSACVALSQMPNLPIYFNAGQVIGDTTGTTKGWICKKSGVRYSTTRQTSTAYSLYDLVMYNEYLLICVSSGTTGSGTISPIETNAFVDGSCTWRVLYKGIAEFEAL